MNTQFSIDVCKGLNNQIKESLNSRDIIIKETIESLEAKDWKYLYLRGLTGWGNYEEIEVVVSERLADNLFQYIKGFTYEFSLIETHLDEVVIWWNNIGYEDIDNHKMLQRFLYGSYENSPDEIINVSAMKKID